MGSGILVTACILRRDPASTRPPSWGPADDRLGMQAARPWCPWERTRLAAFRVLPFCCLQTPGKVLSPGLISTKRGPRDMGAETMGEPRPPPKDGEGVVVGRPEANRASSSQGPDVEAGRLKTGPRGGDSPAGDNRGSHALRFGPRGTHTVLVVRGSPRIRCGVLTSRRGLWAHPLIHFKKLQVIPRSNPWCTKFAHCSQL